MCHKKTNNYGCIHPPLLHIDQEHVVVDELHLLMRRTDVLFRNVVEDAVRLDKKEHFDKRSNSVKNRHRSELVHSIQSCGIHFQIWKWRKNDGFGDSFKKILHGLTGSNMKKNAKRDTVCFGRKTMLERIGKT